jgi:hypothetical protein
MAGVIVSFSLLSETIWADSVAGFAVTGDDKGNSLRVFSRRGEKKRSSFSSLLREARTLPDCRNSSICDLR